MQAPVHWKRLKRILASSLLISMASFSLATHAKTYEVQPVDLVKLISLFLVPASKDDTLQQWSWEPFPNELAIVWKSKDRVWVKDIKAFIRSGNVIVTVSDKPVTTQPWEITLLGGETGISTLVIGSPQDKEFNVGLPAALEKIGIKYSLYKCDKYKFPSYSERVYEITAADKKPAWLAYITSEGSAGYSVDVKVFLSKQEADAEPDLVADCSKP